MKTAARKAKPTRYDDRQAANLILRCEATRELLSATDRARLDRVWSEGCDYVAESQVDGAIDQWIARINSTDPERATTIREAIEAAQGDGGPGSGSFGGASEEQNGAREGRTRGTDANSGGFGGAWLEPMPIRADLLPVPPMEAEMLPQVLRDWLVDIARRLGCPLDFPAVGAVVVLGSLIGRSVCIRPKCKDDWTVVPNLWGGIVAPPGFLKSPALAEVKRPLDRLVMEA